MRISLLALTLIFNTSCLTKAVVNKITNTHTYPVNNAESHTARLIEGGVDYLIFTNDNNGKPMIFHCKKITY